MHQVAITSRHDGLQQVITPYNIIIMHRRLGIKRHSSPSKCIGHLNNMADTLAGTIIQWQCSLLKTCSSTHHTVNEAALLMVQISSSTQHTTFEAVQTSSRTQLTIYKAYTAYNIRMKQQCSWHKYAAVLGIQYCKVLLLDKYGY